MGNFGGGGGFSSSPADQEGPVSFGSETTDVHQVTGSFSISGDIAGKPAANMGAVTGTTFLSAGDVDFTAGTTNVGSVTGSGLYIYTGEMTVGANADMGQVILTGSLQGSAVTGSGFKTAAHGPELGFSGSYHSDKKRYYRTGSSADDTGQAVFERSGQIHFTCTSEVANNGEFYTSVHNYAGVLKATDNVIVNIVEQTGSADNPVGGGSLGPSQVSVARPSIADYDGAVYISFTFTNIRGTKQNPNEFVVFNWTAI